MRAIIISAVSALALAACAPSSESHSGEPETKAADYAASGLIAGTLPEIAGALAAGETTSEAIVTEYLERIKRVDRAGPTLQAVLTINPNALADARASDARRASGGALGPLDGVPILLKDNIESADQMPTTAGSLALIDNVTGRDSPLVAGLRAQGAIILGKTNLSEWANFRSDYSMSGWSALGGQTRNPHMLDRNPCGSSSGSGAGVAASLAAGAVGTETNGSIICPSNVNGIVGFKPTVGLVSQQYIVPISATQDTAGPMTKSVKGAAMMLAAMATGEAKADYAAALDAHSLQGTRVGVARFAQGESPATIARFEAALHELEEAGAILVELTPPDIDERALRAAEILVMRHEFKSGMDAYLSDAAPAVEVRSLDALIAFNTDHADVEMTLFGQDRAEEAATAGGLDDPAYLSARETALRLMRAEGIDKILADNDVKVIVAPSGTPSPRIDPVNGDVWPEWVGLDSMAAIAGYPHLTVPMGTINGAPIGLSFIASANEDAAVLSYGYAFEQQAKLRAEPRYLKSAEEIPSIGAAMKRKADLLGGQ